MKFLHSGKLHQRSSRRGGMLILVLMIFAVSLILISSAMTITLASRNRYYVDTEKSQERLTLSCAAETVIDAIMSQEITDDQLRLMATTNGASNYVITGASSSKLNSSPSSNAGTSIAPGLANSTGKNETYFTVRPDPDAANDIIMEFSTVIDLTGSDGNYENLRVYLHKKPDTPNPQLCANMATFGAEGSSISIPRLHITATNSYSVFHGNVDIIAASGETHVSNKMVFTGKVRPAQGTLFYNDVIFYGPNACIDTSSAGTGNGIQTTGGIYFLGVDFNGASGKQEVFRTSSGTATAAPGNQVVTAGGGAYFYNANMTVNGDTLQSSSQNAPYWVVSTGSKVTNNNGGTNSSVTYINDGGTYINNGGSSSRNAVAAADLTGDAQTNYQNISSKANQYRTGSELKSAAEQQVPTSEYINELFGDHKNGTSVSSGANFSQVFEGGKDYKMSGTYNFGSPTTMEINLAQGNTYIYFSSDVTFNNFTIKVSNATENRLYILLGTGVKFHVGGGPNDWKPQTGIISCDTRTGSGDSSKAVTGSQHPACVIAGFGNNLLHVATQCSVLEAYISLAGESTIWYQTGGNRFYGRMEAKNFVFNFQLDNGGSIQGNQLTMEDCPGMDENSGGGETPLAPHYEVTGYEYFYRTAAPAGDEG
ncbi:MAG: hypothetical protein IK020_06880 [Clostridiales bacterium]|nr:hypothetical protein [Clostridiales bacterium]